MKCNWFCRFGVYLLVVVTITVMAGCYAPFRSPAIPARTLPDEFRFPLRSTSAPLNLANLTVRIPGDYVLGNNDVLDVTVPDLYDGAATRPLQVRVMASGEIHLPLAGPIRVGGLNLLQAQEKITAAYADGLIKNPRVNISLAQKSSIDVVVLGEVNQPGVHTLPKYQNDVGHALASAGGLSRDAAETVEVHRRIELAALLQPRSDHGAIEEYEDDVVDPKKILRIPLRGLPAGAITEQDVTLNPGDVIVVPSRKNEVFFVVGKLAESNLLRFSLGDRERELGTGLILPRDRDIDVVTAVAMAGYIDPIDSPTTVTVQRGQPGDQPMLIHVDLIKARYDRSETVLVQAGDIIYINPDAAWWFRRTFDRVVPDLITLPYSNWMSRLFIGPRGNN